MRREPWAGHSLAAVTALTVHGEASPGWRYRASWWRLSAFGLRAPVRPPSPWVEEILTQETGAFTARALHLRVTASSPGK